MTNQNNALFTLVSTVVDAQKEDSNLHSKNTLSSLNNLIYVYVYGGIDCADLPNSEAVKQFQIDI